jgi:uncharacterized protein YbjT (DUF2867 family)
VTTVVHVTGGSGFLGGHVVPALLRRGHDVTAMARSHDAASRLAALGATPIPGDLDDPASVDRCFVTSRAKALVNLASLGFGHTPTIVAAAEEAGLRRAVFVSTTAIFTTLDAETKAVRAAAEESIRSSALQWTIVRPTMIYGEPGDRNMARLLKLVRRLPVVPLPGGGVRLQQPVHVADLAETVVAALERPEAIGRSYDVAGPEPLTLRGVVREAGEASGRRVRTPSVPLRPLVKGVQVYERLSRRPRLRAEQIERLAEDKAFDNGPAIADLGHAPRSFAEGIRQELERCR